MAGNGTLEQDLRRVTQEVVVREAPIAAQTETDEGMHPLDPSDSGANAAHAVHQCLTAAEHIRSMCAEIVSVAQTISATGEAIATGLENKATQFAAMVKSMHDLARQTHDVFAQERARLSDFKLPG